MAGVVLRAAARLGCPFCEQGRPAETAYGVRIFSGEVSDAYLQRAAIQRGYTVVVWRGSHVVEPTELSEDEAGRYWREVLRVARALEDHLRPVKMNYDILGNELPHLHTHVLPRYGDDPRPGWPFPFPAAEVPRHPEDVFRADLAALSVLLG